MAVIEVLASGLGLLESVRWAHGSVWFSDWTQGRIHRMDPASGRSDTVAEVDSLPLCFDLVGDELIVLDGRHHQVLRGPIDGPLEPWVDTRSLALGAGNEVLAGADAVYLNFGNFDPRAGFPTSPVGVLARITTDGVSKIEATGLALPNGMALTPDGRGLVVAESHAGRLSAWSINSDGSLGVRRLWAAIPGSAPDGVAMTPDGTCWFADVSTSSVTRVTEGGRILERVGLDRGAFSCAWADELSTLFVATAHWPGPEGLGDPAHVWDGTLLAITFD